MGLLSLFSGGSSSSANTTKQNFSTTSVNTTRDIGLTGNAAVDVYKAGVGGGIALANIGAEQNKNISGLLSSIDKSNKILYDSFAGNTSGILSKALDFGSGFIKTSYSDVNDARAGAYADVNTARQTGSALVQSALSQATQSAGNVSQSLIKFGTVALVMVAGVYALRGLK